LRIIQRKTTITTITKRIISKRLQNRIRKPFFFFFFFPNVTAVRTRSLSGANTTRTRLRETEQTLCLPKPLSSVVVSSMIKAERQNTERLLTLENTRRI
jgi:hypothetical protein